MNSLRIIVAAFYINTYHLLLVTTSSLLTSMCAIFILNNVCHNSPHGTHTHNHLKRRLNGEGLAA